MHKILTTLPFLETSPLQVQPAPTTPHMFEGVYRKNNKHKIEVNTEITLKNMKAIYCNDCEIWLNGTIQYVKHLTGYKHHKKTQQKRIA